MPDQHRDEISLDCLDASSSASTSSDTAFQSVILAASREAIIGTDAKWVVRFCNRSAAELLGLPEEGIVGQSIFELLSPAALDTFRNDLSGSGSGQARISLTAGAQTRMIDVGAAASRMENGSTVGYSFSFRDVTEQVNDISPWAIEAERAMLEKILEQLPSGVIIVEAPDGAVMRVNQAAIDMFKGRFTFSENIIEYSEWVGFKPNGVQYQPNEWPVARSILTGEVVVNEEIIFPVGSDETRIMAVNSAPVRDTSGKIIAGVIVIDDITDQKQAEEELRSSQRWLKEIAERFRTSVESLLDGFAILSAIRDENDEIIDFRYDYMNETGCRMGNSTKEQIIGRTLLELLPAQRESGFFDLYKELVKTGVPVEAEDEEYENLPGGGKRLLRTFEVRAVKQSDGFVVTWRDISERKHTEEKLKTYAARLKRSNEELNQFALIASHDLQEPLRKIRQFSDSLRRSLSDNLPLEAEDSLNRMQRAAERMQAMIDGLLELSRVNTRGGTFEPTDLTRLVKEVISDLEPRLEASGGQVLCDPLPTAEVDAMQFRRLMQNLLSNALKYHRKEVPPVVHVRAAVLGETRGNPARLAISVEDNGIGINEEDANRIFRPFQRLHGIGEYEGTGMGLAICQKIVERHRGKIEVRSSPSAGTTFTIVIPLEQR